ncbi:YhgE/Pip domain-containing protein [Nocardia sp. NPDC058658]|uniref:YhgE/Pip domain-containing protein n=1 Tax=Nocardia sp. NPDC058658 TaxID=3346580 RepID=UPI00365A92D9
MRIWLFPTMVLTLLSALMATMYLGYVADPEKNLHDFPIALVDQDVGDTLGSPPQWRDVGGEITAALREGVPADKIDLRVLGIAEAERQLRSGELYGAIIISGDFTKRLGNLGMGSVLPGEMERPTITVRTNPRTGAFASAIVTRFSERALTEVNTRIGEQLLTTVTTALGPDHALPGAAAVTLRSPVEVIVTEFHPLPDGSGAGLGAFFYALVLLLAGTVGAMIVHTMVDGALGFVPTEYGPWSPHVRTARISRFRTLLLKWGVLIVAAHCVAAVLLAVAHVLEIPVTQPLPLFLYSAFAMIAVGVTGLSVLAALGSAGLLVNLIVFVILGLPSSAGSIPIEATPRYFGVLASFEPLHQVYTAVRAILYFDADLGSGLARGFWMTLLGLAIGLALGAVSTSIYDRVGLTRSRPANR